MTERKRRARKPLSPKDLALLQALYISNHELQWTIGDGNQFEWRISRFIPGRGWFDGHGPTVLKAVAELDSKLGGHEQ